MSDSAASLRELAQRCRALAGGASAECVALSLTQIAADYDRQADRIDKAEARARQRLAERTPLDPRGS